MIAVFIGGGLGSVLRYGVSIGLAWLSLPSGYLDLVATSVVNLAGAWFLGFVNGSGKFSRPSSKLFWGTGFAGGFTTMSGLVVITSGAELGLGPTGVIYWIAIMLQFVLGVFLYRIGLKSMGLAR
jgi:fluoride ion exporter CrcB/FEX